jgi:ABC-type glutathione transport system ATPase component
MTQPETHQDGRDTTSLASRLRHVYWIGGASGAGKSTIARRFAGRHGLRLYSTGEAMSDHAHRWRPEDCPLTEWEKMSMDERWVNRSPETLLKPFTGSAARASA